MAKNEHLRHANHVSLPVPSGTKSGDVVKVGVLNGVAETTRGEGGNPETHASVWLDGSHHLPVTGAIKNIGDPVYLAAGKLNAAGTVIFGAALATQTSDGTIPVKILQPGTPAA